MTTTTNTTKKQKRSYNKTGKFSTKSTPVNVQNITAAIRALEGLTNAEQRLVFTSYKSVFSKLN